MAPANDDMREQNTNEQNPMDKRKLESNPSNELHQDVETNQGQTFGQMSDSQAIQSQKAGFIVIGDNAQIHPDGVSSGSSQALKFQCDIPPLLPYLPDRREQEAELRMAIEQFKPANRPIICIIHGDHIQSHDMYWQRLKEITIPKILGLNQATEKCQTYLLPWPPKLRNLDSLKTRFHRSLAFEIEHNYKASIEKINQTISLQPGPVIIHTHLHTDNWREQGQNLLDKILEFWQEWPLIQSEHPLFVCVFIKYQIKPYQTFSQSLHPQKLSLFQKIQSLLRARWLAYQRNRVNVKIQQELDILAQDTPESSRSLNCVVLSKLEGIQRCHMNNWAHSPEFQKFAGETSTDYYIKEIARVFDEWEQTTGFPTMPMDIIAEEIKKSIKAYAVPQENQV